MNFYILIISEEIKYILFYKKYQINIVQLYFYLKKVLDVNAVIAIAKAIILLKGYL